VQVDELTLEVRLVVPPRHAVDPGGRILGYRVERVFQGLYRDMMQKRGELLLLG